jgi:hypothetical protein
LLPPRYDRYDRAGSDDPLKCRRAASKVQTGDLVGCISEGFGNMVSTSIRRLCAILVISCLSLTAMGAATAADLSGTWSGTWQSGSTRHQGTLQAVFVRVDANCYQVNFSGRFLRFVPFRYSIVMSAVESGDVVTLSGSKYLGRLFGTFTFAATATECRFDATYSSCKDHGYFRMTRCSHASSCSHL